MTKLPRLIISLPSDIEQAVNEIKARPGNEKMPKSKIICNLVRSGLSIQRDAGDVHTQADCQNGVS